MKKLIAITLALSALTVSAFAAGSAAPATEEPNVTIAAQEKAEISAKLSESDALAAALKDAGEREADVTVSKNKLSEKETEDGTAIAVYTVKFATDTTTYKYYVDANTGAILYKNIEFTSPDVVFKSHKSGDSDSRSKTAAGDQSDGGETVTRSGRSGGSGSKSSASSEMSDSVSTDAVIA